MSLFNRTKNWGYKVGIFEANNKRKQLLKMIEELDELFDALDSGTAEEVSMEIGDLYVVLGIIAHMTGNVPDDCLSLALAKIEKREGRIVDGVFVKDDEVKR